jgi:hypothetical protein
MALNGCLFLDGDREALEGSPWPTDLPVRALCLPSRGEGLVESADAEGVHGRFDVLCAGDHRLHQFHRRQLSGLEKGDGLSRRQVAQFIHEGSLRSTGAKSRNEGGLSFR